MRTARTRACVAGAMVVLIVAPGRAEAQGLGYGVAGPAGVSGFFTSTRTLHAAGGGEVLAANRVGVGGELGVLGTTSILLTGSLNGVAHLVPNRREHRVSPFVTAGWTRMGSGEGSFDAWNAGGGVDLWTTERAGIRLEFRDHVRPDSRGTVHYWTVRGGIAFR